MIYKKSDLLKISWEDFDKYISNIQSEIQKYLEQNNLTIDLVVPVMRGGGMPGLKLAFMFNVIRILPYQYKYFHGEKDFELKQVYESNITNLINFSNKNPVILVVEGNHSTGNIANKVIEDIKRQIPYSKIIYVALAKDYKYKDSVKNTDFTACGFYTNENKELSKTECDKLNISFDKVFIFPWESKEEELASLNNTEFNYSNQSDF